MRQTIFDRLAAPPAARLLGWQVLDLDEAAGTIRVSFEARDTFLNPAGFVQGGLLAAMLDDTMGPALFAKTNGEAFPTTIDMNVSFLSPARPGTLIGEGQVVQLGKSIAFLEATLFDENGQAIARATSSVRLVRPNFPR